MALRGPPRGTTTVTLVVVVTVTVATVSVLVGAVTVVVPSVIVLGGSTTASVTVLVGFISNNLTMGVTKTGAHDVRSYTVSARNELQSHRRMRNGGLASNPVTARTHLLKMHRLVVMEAMEPGNRIRPYNSGRILPDEGRVNITALGLVVPKKIRARDEEVQPAEYWKSSAKVGVATSRVADMGFTAEVCF